MTWLLLGMVATGVVLLVLAMTARRDDQGGDDTYTAPPPEERRAKRAPRRSTPTSATRPASPGESPSPVPSPAAPPPAVPTPARPVADAPDAETAVVSALTILAARPGDRLVIAGAADDGTDVEFLVQTRHRYEAQGEQWFEVAGEYRGHTAYVEAYEADGLEVLAILDPHPLELGDLGITEDDLIRMDEEESEENSIAYDNHRWHYACSEETFFFENGNGAPEGFYAWDFSEDTGERVIGIEKWEGEDFEISLSRRIDPADITVYRA